jgi:DEAD/DEAH box helicase domain-containing protein
VTELHAEDLHAVLEPADDADEYTQPREETDIAVVTEDRAMALGEGRAHVGTVTVTHRLVAYQRRRVSTNEVFEVVPLDFPPRELETRACWYTLPLDALGRRGVDPSRVIGAVHAASTH